MVSPVPSLLPLLLPDSAEPPFPGQHPGADRSTACFYSRGSTGAQPPLVDGLGPLGLSFAALLGRPLSPSSPGVRPRGLLPAQQRRAQPGLPTRHCASPAPVQPQPPAGSLPAAQPFDEPPERKQTRPGSAL